MIGAVETDLFAVRFRARVRAPGCQCRSFGVASVKEHTKSSCIEATDVSEYQAWHLRPEWSLRKEIFWFFLFRGRWLQSLFWPVSPLRVDGIVEIYLVLQFVCPRVEARLFRNSKQRSAWWWELTKGCLFVALFLPSTWQALFPFSRFQMNRRDWPSSSRVVDGLALWSTRSVASQEHLYGSALVLED